MSGEGKQSNTVLTITKILNTLYKAMFSFLQKVVSTIQDELCPVSERYRMLFQAVKLLLWIVAAVSYRTNARCALHQLEDIRQESVSSNVEKIIFNQIITSLLN